MEMSQGIKSFRAWNVPELIGAWNVSGHERSRGMKGLGAWNVSGHERSRGMKCLMCYDLWDILQFYNIYSTFWPLKSPVFVCLPYHCTVSIFPIFVWLQFLRLHCLDITFKHTSGLLRCQGFQKKYKRPTKVVKAKPKAREPKMLNF